MRHLRRKLLRARVLIPLAAAVALALWVWHPWQPRIVIHERINPKDGAVMVWVPAGEFRMGTNTGDLLRNAIGQRDWEMARDVVLHRQTPPSEETPAHAVYLDGYWIYRHEVTVAQYRQFCKETGWVMPEAPEWGWQDNHPIVNVSWNEASAYAVWAEAALPTEAQWEKAARGTDGRIYPWGNDQGDVEATLATKTHLPICSIPAYASPYGVEGMAGNVWEWCADWYHAAYYQHTSRHNPVGPTTGVDRVLRGGDMGDADPVITHTTDRLPFNPKRKSNNLGFRCVVRSSGP